MPARPSQRAPWLPWTLVPLAVAGVTALWVLVALHSERQASWMAVIAALDALWVLGYGPRLAPARRALLAVGATAVTILLVNWILAATYAGGQVGLAPWEAVLRLGPGHARTLASLANAWQDQVWIAVALATAAGGPFLSDRLRAPSAR
jgi:hypothetical protein